MYDFYGTDNNGPFRQKKNSGLSIRVCCVVKQLDSVETKVLRLPNELLEQISLNECILLAGHSFYTGQ
jgi:hypothetical protein